MSSFCWGFLCGLLVLPIGFVAGLLVAILCAEDEVASCRREEHGGKR